MRMAPMAKFGAISTPVSGLDPRRSRSVANRSSVKPVVPTTAWMPWVTQYSRFPITTSGWVKSMTTSAPASDSVSIGSPASTSATNSRSSASRTASHIADPTLPRAPSIPTLVTVIASSIRSTIRKTIGRRVGRASASPATCTEARTPGGDTCLGRGPDGGVGGSALRVLRALGVGRVLVGRVVLAYGSEAVPAAVVELRDLDLDLVPDVDHVLHLAVALALAELGDVDQPVAAGQQRHEGTERRGVDDRAEEALPDLGQLRVGDGVDLVDRGLRGLAVGGTDVDGAVVLDGDVGARLLGDRVDHLALGPALLTGLVERDLVRIDPRA